MQNNSQKKADSLVRLSIQSSKSKTLEDIQEKSDESAEAPVIHQKPIRTPTNAASTKLEIQLPVSLTHSGLSKQSVSKKSQSSVSRNRPSSGNLYEFNSQGTCSFNISSQTPSQSLDRILTTPSLCSKSSVPRTFSPLKDKLFESSPNKQADSFNSPDFQQIYLTSNILTQSQTTDQNDQTYKNLNIPVVESFQLLTTAESLNQPQPNKLNDKTHIQQNIELDKEENLRLEELKKTVDVDIRQQKCQTIWRGILVFLLFVALFNYLDWIERPRQYSAKLQIEEITEIEVELQQLQVASQNDQIIEIQETEEQTQIQSIVNSDLEQFKFVLSESQRLFKAIEIYLESTVQLNLNPDLPLVYAQIQESNIKNATQTELCLNFVKQSIEEFSKKEYDRLEFEGGSFNYHGLRFVINRMIYAVCYQ